jgi:hypothetical protein
MAPLFELQRLLIFFSILFCTVIMRSTSTPAFAAPFRLHRLIRFIPKTPEFRRAAESPAIYMPLSDQVFFQKNYGVNRKDAECRTPGVNSVTWRPAGILAGIPYNSKN